MRSVIKKRISEYTLHKFLGCFFFFFPLLSDYTQGSSSSYKYFHDKATDSQCKTVVDRQDYLHLINLQQHNQKCKNMFTEAFEGALLQWCLEMAD